MKRALFALLLCSIAAPATADYYAGYAIGATTIDLPGPGRVTDAALTVHAGAQISDRYGIELRAGFTNTGNDTVNGQRIDAGVDWFFSTFAVVHALPDRVIDPYVLLGGTALQLDGGQDESAFSAGVGVQIRTNSASRLRLEYVHYLDENDLRIGGINLVMSHRF